MVFVFLIVKSFSIPSRWHFESDFFYSRTTLVVHQLNMKSRKTLAEVLKYSCKIELVGFVRSCTDTIHLRVNPFIYAKRNCRNFDLLLAITVAQKCQTELSFENNPSVTGQQ